MAKMFYTLEEACAKLGKSEAQVKEMVTKGQLSEFRDRDRLMFKSEQVDLLSSSTGSSKIDEVFKLADSGENETISLANSGSQSAIGVADSGIGQANVKEQTGISIFEAEATEEADPSAVTRVTPSLAGGSALGGSGLLEATRDGGDSALGAELIKDSFGTGQTSALAGSGSTPTDGAMFEGAPSTEAATPAPLLAAMAEPYDGAGSGLVGGLALGMVLTLAIGLVAVVLAITGGSSLLDTLGSNMMIFIGAAAVVTLLGGVLGWVLGKRG